jgi:hypothetical protein
MAAARGRRRSRGQGDNAGPTLADLGEFLDSLPQEGDPEQVDAWTVGDPCIARGQLGKVQSLGPGCASVFIDNGRTLFVGIEELSAPRVATRDREPTG